MGFLRKAADRREREIWGDVVLLPDESPVTYAHLVIAFTDGDQPGTAYLTDRRFLWRSADGNAFACALDSCAGWASRDDRPGQVGLGTGFRTEPGQEPAALLLYPQQPRSAANRTLAKGFFEAFVERVQGLHPEWSIKRAD